MSIQQDINSALGQVGVLAALNPTLQARAKEGDELRRVERDVKRGEKRFKNLKEEADKEKENFENITKDLKSLSLEDFKSPEEFKAKTKGLRERLDESRVKTKANKNEMGELEDKFGKMIRQGYDISPKRFKNRYFKLLKGEARVEIAEAARQRAEQIANDKTLEKKKHQEYMSNLYKGVNRTMQGFKDMSREQQENIIKKITPGDRRKIANEEKWRNQIYGK